MSLSIIVACDLNHGIGYKGYLLFRIPEDIRRFKELTTNHTIIMGRKTFESLPNVLPNRHHIVITRNLKYKKTSKQVSIINNLDEAMIKLFQDLDEEIFVIGGSEIYKQFLPYCNRIYLTLVHTICEADTFFDFNSKFNKFNLSKWSDRKTALPNYDYQFLEFMKA
jgi:dihydrofolate reductase